MGVIKNNRPQVCAPTVDDNADGQDVHLNLTPEEPHLNTGEEELNHNGSDRNGGFSSLCRIKNQAIHKRRNRGPSTPCGFSGGKKGGVRRTRRFENNKNLIDSCGGDDFDELSIDDFSNAKGVFSSLFEDAEKMQLWLNFLETSEANQNAVLRKKAKRVSNNKIRDVKSSSLQEEDDIDDSGHIMIMSGFTADGAAANEKRQQNNSNRSSSYCNNKALAPEVAFYKIKKCLRRILKQKSAPVYFIKDLEDEVITQFHARPNCIYDSPHFTSFQRLLLHGLSTYNALHSRSYDKDGARWMHIHNPRRVFCAPVLPLSEFISTRYRND